ncbi:MAG: ABC transporter permease subunit [Ruminococcus sp.]|nr:ABC transporter permease subunit [Ruminococcus sp.]
MNGFFAFLKKEFFELSRSGKLMILSFLFILFGIMNPAVAKITPWILEQSADTFKSQGLIIGEITVTAMDSWLQFVKNIPMAMIVMLIMFSGTFTGEYSKGTFIPIITKGLSRNSIVISKAVVMIVTWSIGFGLCFGITYGYTAYYWNNSVVNNIAFMAFCWWIMGIFLICVLTLFSAFSNSSPQVMAGVGGVYAVMYILGMFGKIKEYLPTFILNSSSLMTAQNKPSEYSTAIIITIALSVLSMLVSLPITHKRQL